MPRINGEESISEQIIKCNKKVEEELEIGESVNNKTINFKFDKYISLVLFTYMFSKDPKVKNVRNFEGASVPSGWKITRIK